MQKRFRTEDEKRFKETNIKNERLRIDSKYRVENK